MGVVGALGIVRILLEDGGLLYLRSTSLIAGILAIRCNKFERSPIQNWWSFEKIQAVISADVPQPFSCPVPIQRLRATRKRARRSRTKRA